MQPTTLFDYWRSSASYRVRIALHLANIDFSIVSVDLLQGAHKFPDHLARHPQGLVPVLDIDGHLLTQSLAILDYVDATRNLNLLPTDPTLRARAMAMAHTLAVDVHPVCNTSVAAYAMSLTTDAEQTRLNWMHRFIRPGLEAFETQLKSFKQATFCLGEQPGLADICLVPQLYNAQRWGVEFADLERISAVQAACDEHNAFRAAHPDVNQPATEA